MQEFLRRLACPVVPSHTSVMSVLSHGAERSICYDGIPKVDLRLENPVFHDVCQLLVHQIRQSPDNHLGLRYDKARYRLFSAASHV